MDFFIENILYIALLLTVFTFLFLFIKNKNHLNSSYNTSKISQYELELKLRAYERLILFLDRIEPTGMINRLELHQMDVQTTASQLIKNIIIEYEYNVSQQIYVSDNLWDLIELLKNKTINHISDTVQSLNKTASTQLLMKALNNSSQNKLLIMQAKKMLKKEIEPYHNSDNCLCIAITCGVISVFSLLVIT